MKIVKKYECDYCGKIFDKECDCKLHERYNHDCLKCEFHKIVGQYSDEIECMRKGGCKYDVYKTCSRAGRI